MSDDLSLHGFSVDWGEKDGLLWITMVVPRHFLAQFSTPGDVLASFLVAIQARGVNIGDTVSLHTRIRHGTARLAWTGEAHGNIAPIMTATVKELMGNG